MLEAHGELGLEQITEVVREKLSNQVLTEGNLKQILQTLVYDGMVGPPARAWHLGSDYRPSI